MLFMTYRHIFQSTAQYQSYSWIRTLHKLNSTYPFQYYNIGNSISTFKLSSVLQTEESLIRVPQSNICIFFLPVCLSVFVLPWPGCSFTAL